MSRTQTFDPDPTLEYAWVEVPIRGLRLKIKLAIHPSSPTYPGGGFEVVDFRAPREAPWVDWSWLDANMRELLLNIPFQPTT